MNKFFGTVSQLAIRFACFYEVVALIFFFCSCRCATFEGLLSRCFNPGQNDFFEALVSRRFLGLVTNQAFVPFFPSFPWQKFPTFFWNFGFFSPHRTVRGTGKQGRCVSAAVGGSPRSSETHFSPLLFRPVFQVFRKVSSRVAFQFVLV